MELFIVMWKLSSLNVNMVAPIVLSIIAAITQPCKFPIGFNHSCRTTYSNSRYPFSALSTTGLNQAIKGDGDN